jgi:XTP/dITP diphosphohydrolase
VTLLYGTSNRAKVDHMNEILHGLDIKIAGVADKISPLPSVSEDGQTPLENARIKALTYGRLTGGPLFSCDSGLYFKEVYPEDQPGLFIRRVGGRELTDREMIDYYSQLADRYGGKLTARYENAICLVQEGRVISEYQGHDLSSVDFYMVNRPSRVRREGFPLDSLSVDPHRGVYYIESGCEGRRDDTNKIIGFRKFFTAYLESLTKS